MSDQTNSPSEGSNSHNYSTPVPFPPEFSMILSYREKMRQLSQQPVDGDRAAPVSGNHENLALILDRGKLESLLNQDDCKDLVAFFASEPKDVNDVSRNTIVLMGLDGQSKLLPFTNGRFPIVQETWSQFLSVNDDEESESKFREFFRISPE